MDILAAARANADRLEDEFNSLRADCPPPDPVLLQQFVDEVATSGRVAVNMRPWIAADFVENSRYQNMYAAVAEASELSGRDAIELLREQLPADDDFRPRKGPWPRRFARCYERPVMV